MAKAERIKQATAALTERLSALKAEGVDISSAAAEAVGKVEA